MTSLLDRSLLFLRSILGYLRFPTQSGYARYRGIFRTPEQAIAAAPKNRKIGYNHEELAQEYRDQGAEGIGFYDYPMLFWLQNLLREGSVLFDFGGNIGTHFYTYGKYLTYPSGLQWIVCELPTIVAAGEDFAQQKKRSQLRFTDQFEKADGADIFMASGSVQYVGSLATDLAKLQRKPVHILLNRFPLCEGKPFVTLQNGGLVFYPVYVFAKRDFVNSILALGYELVDQWKDPGEPCAVPFHPEFKSLMFHGLYFKAIDS
ncbi:MAG TPA: methyltransferase, TIGR04325 family [Thermosynechococcaceae cyanobacterium]